MCRPVGIYGHNIIKAIAITDESNMSPIGSTTRKRIPIHAFGESSRFTYPDRQNIKIAKHIKDD